MSAPVDDLIADGDCVVVKGDKAFFNGLLAALGDRAAGVVNADLDTRPDVHVGGDGNGGLVSTFPKRPDLPPRPVPPYPVDDDRVFVFYVGETARQSAHLCNLVPVVLDAESPTFARVLKAADAETSGLGLQLVEGRPVVTHLAV